MRPIKNKPWFLYVVRCNDDTLYTGVTTDIDRRLHEHNCSIKGAKYTRARRPVNLVYYVKYPNRSAALKAEHLFKKKKRIQKDAIITGFKIG